LTRKRKSLIRFSRRRLPEWDWDFPFRADVRKERERQEARKQEEIRQLAAALNGHMDPMKKVVDTVKKAIPNNFAYVKAATNSNYPWAIWFMCTMPETMAY
jgi:hypothetical protein